MTLFHQTTLSMFPVSHSPLETTPAIR